MNHDSEKETAYLSKTYRQMTQKEHILEVQDTYVGSIESVTRAMLVRDRESGRLEPRAISVVPALHKIVDEALMNARDHAYRMINRLREQGLELDKEKRRRVNEIHMDVDADTGTITVKNDGDGLDVAIHPVHNVWIPEMVFTNPLASTNFDKGDDDVVAGKNGYGAKCTIIWSDWARLETLDAPRGLRYIQVFENNLAIIHPPEISKLTKTELSKGSFTSLSFRPDFARLGLVNESGPCLTNDFVDLLHKRAVDVACISPLTYSVGGKQALRVFFNEQPIQQRSFKEYVQLIVPEGVKIEYERANDRWEYAVVLKKDVDEIFRNSVCDVPETWRHVSFVNGVCTYAGGSHVNFVLKQIVDALMELAHKKKNKKDFEIKPDAVRKQLMLFLRCDVVKPAFTDQSKSTLATKLVFDKKNPICKVSDAFVKKVAAMGDGYILERILVDSAKRQDQVANAVVSAGARKYGPVTGIPMFTDANFARCPSQVKDGRRIRLILVEGDSARTGVTSGNIDPDYNGILGMRGKILNLRNASKNKYQKDGTFTTFLMKVLGLKYGQVYSSIEDVIRNMRYHEILIMCDQDYDGFHIKGLTINMFSVLWPSLLQIKDFMRIWSTPIVIVRPPKLPEQFWYSLHKFQEWIDANPSMKQFAKYYKGLGTSDKSEWVQYVQNPKISSIEFTPDSETCLEKVFGKKASLRKQWLAEGRKGNLDMDAPSVKVEDFIDCEMILFSLADNIRSIPSVMDGLKPSQRKVLFSCFLKNVVSEVKVAPLAGTVVGDAQYHHGEVSLQATIIGLAQNYVGSNNINLLHPAGQFGTRMSGGEDKASARYIFTRLSPITRLIFHRSDDSVIPQLTEEGYLIEPAFYYPIIPMLLVNGSTGVGTGWKTEISPRDSLQLVEYVRKRLAGQNSEAEKLVFKPCLEGHLGTVYDDPNKPGQFLSKGVWKRVSEDEIEITELPFFKWTLKAKDHYESMLGENVVDKSSASAKIDTVPAPNNRKRAREVCDNDDDEESMAAENHNTLAPKKVLSNVRMHGTDCTVRFTLRFHSASLLDTLLLDVDRFENMLDLVAPIEEYLTAFRPNGEIFVYDSIHAILDEFFGPRLELYEKRKQFMLNKLAEDAKVAEHKALFIRMVRGGELSLSKCASNAEVRELLAEKGFVKKAGEDKPFEYLMSMRMDAQTEKHAANLDAQHRAHLEETFVLQQKTPEQLWTADLDALEKAILENRAERIRMSTPIEAASPSSSAPTKKVVPKKSVAAKRSRK